MNGLKNVSLKQYLEINGVSFSRGNHIVKKSDICEEAVVKQFYLINRLHKLLNNYDGYDVKNIDNKTGKLVEKYKMEIRLGKRYIKNIEENNCLDDFDDMLLSYLERSEKCILQASKNYVDLIKRSMKNREICIHNCYFDNLYENKKISIRDISCISFDMLEVDCINFILEIKESKNKLDLEKLIHEYICIEKLDNYSEEFIKAILSYPSEVMKWFRRYIKDEEKFPKEYYVKKIEKAAKKDGKSII